MMNGSSHTDMVPPCLEEKNGFIHLSLREMSTHCGGHLRIQNTVRALCLLALSQQGSWAVKAEYNAAPGEGRERQGKRGEDEKDEEEEEGEKERKRRKRRRGRKQKKEHLGAQSVKWPSLDFGLVMNSGSWDPTLCQFHGQWGVCFWILSLPLPLPRLSVSL